MVWIYLLEEPSSSLILLHSQYSKGYSLKAPEKMHKIIHLKLIIISYDFVLLNLEKYFTLLAGFEATFLICYS